MPDSCSFCEASPRDRQFLLEGDNGRICDQCIGAPIDIARVESPEYLEEWLHALVARDSLSAERCARSVRTLASIFDCDTSGWIRAMGLYYAQLAERFAVAVAIAETFPEDERQAEDWISLGYSLGELGRFEEARVALLRALPSEPSLDRAMVLNNIAWMNAQCAASLDLALHNLEEARQILRAQSHVDERRLALTYGTEAAVQLAKGNIPECLQALAQADRMHGAHPQRLLLRAKAYRALGQDADARVDARAALALAKVPSSEAIWVREANSILQSPERESRPN